VLALTYVCSAKYALATVNKLLDVLKNHPGVGYDIGCSLKETVAASSLAEKAELYDLIMVVNSFHGHAHGRCCQLRNHPLYVKGVGLEDFETCERVFSASNAVARLIRHASYFHWIQFLDLHFQQWDKDRYFELSK
jgi:Kyakuja-Dileera-Zisupton transposase